MAQVKLTPSQQALYATLQGKARISETASQSMAYNQLTMRQMRVLQDAGLITIDRILASLKIVRFTVLDTGTK